MIQKKYFKSQKKINPKFFKDFNLLSFNIGQKSLKEINKCVVDIFNYNENNKFKNINDVQQFLNRTKFYYLKKNLNMMTKLEKIIIKNFVKFKIFNKFIKGIRFPIDIRIAHPYQPKQLNKKKYLTSSIHCDTWTEEPKDIINAILYLVVNRNTPKINILQTSEKDIDKYEKLSKTYKKKFFLNSKKYFKVLDELERKKSCKIDHRNGQVMIFNGFVPHHTIREGKEVRLSLEFRLKTQNPYQDVSNWKKTNNHGTYWFLPNGRENDFFQRLNTEYLKIKKLKNYKRLVNFRNNEIKRNLFFKNI